MRTILVIESNPLHEKLFSELLQHYGYRVLLAREGAQGLSVARREAADLMIIDCYLPAERPLQTIRAACGDKTMYPMPIIATSAFADESECDDLQAVGCVAFVPKPLSVGSFIATVKSALEGSAFSRPAARAAPAELSALSGR